MRLKERGVSLTPERSTLDVELAVHFHELIGASVTPCPTSDHQTWRGRIIRASSLVKRSLCLSARLKAEGPCGLERGHVEVVLRL